MGGGGGGGNFRPPGIFFFSLSNSLYECFLGLNGVHEFFSFNFPLREFFFCNSLAPSNAPLKFSNGPSLKRTHSFDEKELGGFPLHVPNFYARTRVNFMRVILIESRSNVLKVARKRKS